MTAKQIAAVLAFAGASYGAGLTTASLLAIAPGEKSYFAHGAHLSRTLLSDAGIENKVRCFVTATTGLADGGVGVVDLGGAEPVALAGASAVAANVLGTFCLPAN